MGKTWGTAAEVSETHEMRSALSHLFILSVSLIERQVLPSCTLREMGWVRKVGGVCHPWPKFWREWLESGTCLLSHVRCEKIWAEVVRVKRRNRRR